MSVELLAKLTFVLGISNIVFLVLVLFSCRCMMKTTVSKLWRYKIYQKFYRYHCYYWWIFILSVLLHAVLAVISYGNPF